MIFLRNNGFTIAESWFSSGENLRESGKDADVLFYYQAKTKQASGDHHEFVTLLIDLQKSAEEIQAGISKNTLYEIRRAEEKDDALFESFLKPERNIIDEFSAFFAEFAVRKGLGIVSPKRLEAYSRQGALLLTRSVEANTKRTISWHCYVMSAERSRLLYSASLRLQDNADTALRAKIGRMNRWHHWKDILFCKNLGLKVYDLGGWDPHPPSKSSEGINYFKEQFSSCKEFSFTGSLALSWKGRLYFWLKKLRNR